MLPPSVAEADLLPEGARLATWDEEGLGWNPRRRRLLDDLAEAVELLTAAGGSS